MGWEGVALETEGTDPEFAADVDGAGGGGGGGREVGGVGARRE
jgi:hypothetical protein